MAGGLAITRAMGDFSYKAYGVTANPYILRMTLRPLDKHLVIASDGVWDVMSD